MLWVAHIAKAMIFRANGKHKSVQRYYCKCCKKYFRETTGKVVFGFEEIQSIECLFISYVIGHFDKEVRRTNQVFVIQTSFDWRHKILSAFEHSTPDSFEGIVESDDIFFLESGKGSRELTRPSRKRGSKATKRGISNEQIAVVVTCDRKENKELRVATRGRISKKDLDEVFEGKLDKV